MSCLLTSFLLFFGFHWQSPLVSSLSDFESDLYSIVDCFKENINDEDECERCWHESESLVDNIIKAIDDLPNDSNVNDKKELESLQKKAEALEDFICAVGGLRSLFISRSDFYLANQMVGADIISLYENKFCVDFVEVIIDSYSCVLAESHQEGNFTLNYFWKQRTNSTEKGSGTMGMLSNSFRPTLNTRENKIKGGITIYNVTCKNF